MVPVMVVMMGFMFFMHKDMMSHGDHGAKKEESKPASDKADESKTAPSKSDGSQENQSKEKDSSKHVH